MTKQYNGKKPHHHAELNNTPFADKLQKLQKPAELKNPDHRIRRLSDLDEDGVDHINIYQFPQTELGHLLSPFNDTPFTIPLHGRFNSREGLYYFLLSEIGDDAYRTMKPWTMRKYARINGNMGTHYPNMTYFMAKALCAQMNDNPRIAQLLKDNTLPFEAYFIITSRVENYDSNIMTRPYNSEWMLDIVNTASKAVKSGNEFPLLDFIDDPDAMARLEKRVSRPFTPPPVPKKKPIHQERVPQQKSKKISQNNTTDQQASSESETKQNSYFTIPPQEVRPGEQVIVSNAEKLLDAIDPLKVVDTLPVLNSLQALDDVLDGNSVAIDAEIVKTETVDEIKNSDVEPKQQRGETSFFQHIDEAPFQTSIAAAFTNTNWGETETSNGENKNLVNEVSPTSIGVSVPVTEESKVLDNQSDLQNHENVTQSPSDVVVTNISKDVLIPKYNNI